MLYERIKNKILFLGTREYNAAIAIQGPVESVLEDMNSNYAKAESKRKWVESLVSLIILNW